MTNNETAVSFPARFGTPFAAWSNAKRTPQTGDVAERSDWRANGVLVLAGAVGTFSGWSTAKRMLWRQHCDAGARRLIAGINLAHRSIKATLGSPERFPPRT